MRYKIKILLLSLTILFWSLNTSIEKSGTVDKQLVQVSLYMYYTYFYKQPFKNSTLHQPIVICFNKIVRCYFECVTENVL